MIQTETKTILYIEDDPASRKLVERTLLFAGFNVLLAENGLEGVDLARSALPDLILTDINLPDISGRVITTMLRSESQFKDTPIVALTAQTYEEQRELTLAAGITGYLTKPIDVEALPGQIQRYLDGAQDALDADRLDAARVRYTQEVVRGLEERIRQLEEVNETLRRLDRMKDSFIQITAHELRTPLTLIYGYSRLLEDNPALKSAARDEAGLQDLMYGLVELIERMQGIINEILTVSRIMTNQIDMSVGPVNLGRLVQKVIARHEQAIRNRHLSLVWDASTWPQHLRADGDLLALAMSNLLSNAIKYTPDDGSIYIHAEEDGPNIRISVRDTGIGVDPSERDRIFDRFHTAGDTMLHSTSKTAFRGGGLGLGLAVTKAVAEAHGGSVWVVSAGMDPATLPGSEFVILIPQVAQPQGWSGQTP